MEWGDLAGRARGTGKQPQRSKAPRFFPVPASRRPSPTGETVRKERFEPGAFKYQLNRFVSLNDKLGKLANEALSSPKSGRKFAASLQA